MHIQLQPYRPPYFVIIYQYCESFKNAHHTDTAKCEVHSNSCNSNLKDSTVV